MLQRKFPAKAVASACRALHLASRYRCVPHPDKKRGEDAFFVTRNGVGVADGVGGWAEYGVDPGEYPRRLMVGVKQTLQSTADPREALTIAYEQLQGVVGSTTACIVTCTGNKLLGANLGDSGFLLLRATPGQPKPWAVVRRSEKQTHSFNCPLQLGAGSEDLPVHAELLEMDAKPGDVVVTATDGLYDNVFEREVEDMCNALLPAPLPTLPVLPDAQTDGAGGTGKAISQAPSGDVLQALTDAIVERALKVGGSPTVRSPFAVDAQSYGHFVMGGKMDDVTLICSAVQPDGASSTEAQP